MKKRIEKNLIFYIILFIVSLGIIIFTYNDYFLYKTSILKITNISEKETINEESKEKYYDQIITGIIKNGKYKGKELTCENHTTTSGVYDEQIHKNTELFVSISKDGESILSISGIKRDKYLVLLIVFFINLILLVDKSKGIKTLFSLFINILVSIFVVYFYQTYFSNINILLIFIPVAIFYIVFSLFITNKKDKKTLAAISSAIISLLVSFSLAFILLLIYKEHIPYWFMNYIEAIRDYENIFYVNILLCGLGAIMDISITMASSINELIIRDKKVKKESLIKSGKIISKDIIGTMVNVMFFTIFSGIIPYAVLVVKNNLPISSVLSTVGELEMIRVLTSSISIVLAIPISLYTSIYILKGKEKSE